MIAIPTSPEGQIIALTIIVGTFTYLFFKWLWNKFL